MSEAIFDAWDEPAEAKPQALDEPAAAEPAALNHPHPQPLPAQVEVIPAPQAHCANVARETFARMEFSQSMALRPGDPTQEERLAGLEDKIYSSSLRTVDDMNYWADIDPDAEAPPEAWVRELGEEGARRRFRVAKGAMMPLKDAPIGISAAKSIVSSLAKARAVREAGRSGMQLNVTAIFPTQAQVYEELVVKDE